MHFMLERTHRWLTDMYLCAILHSVHTNKETTVRKLDAFFLIFLVAVFCLMIVLPIVAGIIGYYDGPCGSYAGPYPAVAKNGQCVYVPI